MSSPLVNMYRSAVSAKTKRDSLLMEGIRRLRNISTGVSEIERRNILGRFMNTLRLSGYNSKYRSELLRGILKRDREIQTEIDSGKRVRYRSRQQIVDQKSQQLGKYANTWFLRGDVTNTLKVQYVPGSVLKTKIHQTLSGLSETADNGQTKVVELGGKRILSGLDRQ